MTGIDRIEDLRNVLVAKEEEASFIKKLKEITDIALKHLDIKGYTLGDTEGNFFDITFDLFDYGHGVRLQVSIPTNKKYKLEFISIEGNTERQAYFIDSEDIIYDGDENSSAPYTFRFQKNQDSYELIVRTIGFASTLTPD